MRIPTLNRGLMYLKTMRIPPLTRVRYLKTMRIFVLARVKVPENHENSGSDTGYGT
jgi:hypothetical protein